MPLDVLGGQTPQGCKDEATLIVTFVKHGARHVLTVRIKPKDTVNPPLFVSDLPFSDTRSLETET